MKKLIFLFAITASVLLASCDGVFDDLHDKINPGDQTDFYVAPDGNDNHPGWKAYPMATISKAMEKATAGDRIHVMAGTYAGSVVLKDGVSLYGSYSNHNFSEASRNVIANPSRIIAANNTGGIQASVAITQDIVVDSFEIQGMDASSSQNTNGIFISNTNTDSVISVRRCNIIGGSATSSAYYSYGIHISTSNVLLFNNIVTTSSNISGVHSYGFFIENNSIARIYNNTISFKTVASGSYWIGIRCNASQIEITNNIVDIPNLAPSYGIYFTNPITLINLNNNNTYRHRQGIDNSWVLYYNSTYYTWTDYPANDSNLDIDPYFTGTEPDPYQLSESSTSKYAGQNLYSEGITVDIAGNPRPETGPWSIGAYQYQE